MTVKGGANLPFTRVVLWWVEDWVVVASCKREGTNASAKTLQAHPPGKLLLRLSPPAIGSRGSSLNLVYHGRAPCILHEQAQL